MLAEFIGTFVLVLTIMGVAVDPRWTAPGPLAIGAALGLGVLVFGPLTGAGFNPARAFGPALVSGECGGFDDFLLVYLLAPLLGARGGGARLLHPLHHPGRQGAGGRSSRSGEARRPRA